jgi:uncharacterized membrane protein
MRSFILALIVLTACGGPSGLKFKDPTAAKKPEPAYKTKQFDRGTAFGEMMESVLKPRCFACHNPEKKEGKIDLTSYESIMSKKNLVIAGEPAKSRLHEVLSLNEMPPTPGETLTTEQRDLVYKWIASGARENNESGAPSPTPSPTSAPSASPEAPAAPEPLTLSTPTPNSTNSPASEPNRGVFDTQIKTLLDKNCVECHGEKKKKAGLDFTTYEKLMSEDGLIEPGSPEESALWVQIRDGEMPPDNPLKDEIRLQIFNWIKDGAEN